MKFLTPSIVALFLTSLTVTIPAMCHAEVAYDSLFEKGEPFDAPEFPEEGELNDSDLPPGEEYVDPAFVRKSDKHPGALGDAPIGDSDLGSSDSDFLSLEEHSNQIRGYCRHHPKDPQCAEFRGRLDEKPKKLADLCKVDALHPKCRKYRDKKFETILKAQHECQIEEVKGKKARCMMMQRRLRDMPDY